LLSFSFNNAASSCANPSFFCSYRAREHSFFDAYTELMVSSPFFSSRLTVLFFFLSRFLVRPTSKLPFFSSGFRATLSARLNSSFLSSRQRQCRPYRFSFLSFFSSKGASPFRSFPRSPRRSLLLTVPRLLLSIVYLSPPLVSCLSAIMGPIDVELLDFFPLECVSQHVAAERCLSNLILG